MKHNWEYKRLGDICEILDSRRKPVTQKDRVAGKYPYYGATGIKDYVDSYIFDGTYLLVGEDGAKWGAKDKSAYSISGKSWVNNHAHVLDFTNSIVLQSLAEYYLCHIDLTSYVKGAVVPKLNQNNLINIPIPIPPMEVQEQVVAELDKLNEMIATRKEQLKELDNLAQSLFYDTFGDPISNPKGWDSSALGSICKLSAGGDKPIDTEQEYSEEKCIPIYSNGIANEGLYGYTSKAKIFQPSITISGRGTIGVPFIRKKPFVPIIRLIVATPSTQINLNYLYHLIKVLKLGGNGASIPQLTVPMIKDLFVPVPPLHLQQQFASQVEAIERQKELVEASISEMQTLLDSRMDYWFN